MARVTVEDCVDKVPNRFELVLFSAHRARCMTAGAEVLIDRKNDKNPVVALREIAEEKIQPAELREQLVESMQKRIDVDEPEEESIIAHAPRLMGDADTASPATDQNETPAEETPPAEELAPMDEEDILATLQEMQDAAASSKGSRRGGEKE